MNRRIISIVLLAPALFLAACQSSGAARSSQPANVAAFTRDQGYSLLYSTINEECDVDEVLIIKRPALQVAELIKAIGQCSRDTRTAFKTLAKEDPVIAVDNQGLPEAETNTRKAIRSATSKQILFSSGKEFEFRLLLTQYEALKYITFLARTLGEQEPSKNRKHFLAQVAKQSDALHERVLAQLKEPYIGQAK